LTDKLHVEAQGPVPLDRADQFCSAKRNFHPDIGGVENLELVVLGRDLGPPVTTFDPTISQNLHLATRVAHRDERLTALELGFERAALRRRPLYEQWAQVVCRGLAPAIVILRATG
jgi:hypothetical protein